MRREFELTPEQFQKILDASQPVPYMVISGHEPASRQERANAAWESLGKELGFKHMTVEPVPRKGARFFTAEVVDSKAPESRAIPDQESTDEQEG